MATRIHLSNNLKLLRKSKAWTQDDMMAQCGIARATWSNYENGNTEPDITSLVRIAGVFEVSLDELILKNLENSSLVSAGKKVRKHSYGVENNPETVANESENISTWVVLKQLREIQGKLDRLLDDGK